MTATGHYLPDAQVLARLRVVDGEPAFEVLVPFAVDGGPTVLVDRGYVRPEQGSRVPPIRAAAGRDRDDHGAAARFRTRPGRQGPVPRTTARNRCMRSTPRRSSAVTGVPLAGSYLQLVEDQPGGLGVIALPHLDAGPFLSYGIQWIAFGIIAPIGLGYFVFAEIRAAPTGKRPADQTAAAPLTAEEKLADRYGRRR